MRAKEFITEAKTTREDFEGMTIEMVKNGHVLVINALDDWGNNILGSVAFNIGDDNDLDPQDLKVDERYQGQGIARIMYDYAKSKGYKIHRSYDQTDAGAGFWNKHRGEDVRIWEAFDNPYKGKWEKSDYGDVDLNTKLPDGTNLSIMFNNQQGDEGEEVVQVEFYRNNSQEVTGEGDAQRIFATVLDAIQKYIKKYKPQKLSFSASKATDPTIYYEPDQPQPNPESRAKLYDRLVQRYSKALGYRAFRADTGDLVIYELSRLKQQGVSESSDNNVISFKVQKGKNKFATTLSVGGDPVGVYQYDANTGRSIAEIYPEFKGKGLGKLLVLHAIYTAANLGLDFQEDESRTSEYDNVLDSLSSNGYIVDDDGYWYVTGDGEQYLQQSLKQGVAEGSSNNIPTIGINVRSDGNIDYASLIVDGEKKYESRKTDSLRPYVGKTVGIVRTGNGPAVAIGQVTIGKPIVVDAENFNRLRKQHLVPQGSKFDIDSDGTKYLYPMIDPVRWDNEKLIKHKGIVSRKIEEDKSKDPIVNAVIDFYQHVGKIHKDPIDDYVGTAKELLSQVSDPTVKSKLLDIFRQAKQSPYVQGGVVTTIGALLAGGVLSSAQRMGLNPSQTNLALQAILNTVIPTVVSRINGKSWADTAKYTLASAGIGTGIAGIMEDDLEEDWKSALATGLATGAMAMGAQAKAPEMVQQTVEPGDTVYSIARQNGVNPLEIYKLNKMDRSTKLEIGQKVLVPDYSKPISKMPATVKPTVAQPAPSFKDKISSMIPKFSQDKEEEGVTLLSNNSDAEAALQTAAKSAGLKGAELAQFMAQTRHESWDFSKMKEVGSKKQFAKYEKSRLAKRLGNKVKGDGELFKGRGFIQLTGRDNYTRASQQIFGDDRLVKNPELASRLDVGAKIALWFWKNQVRPNVSNFNNTTEVVKAINANEPTNVVKQRHNKFKEYLAVL